MTIYEKSFGKWIRFTMSDRSVLIRAWNTRISGIRKITISTLTSKSQSQPVVIQSTNSTLPQKHPNRPLKPMTSILLTQPSEQSSWYIPEEDIMRSQSSFWEGGRMPGKPLFPALSTTLCVLTWHQYYRLNELANWKQINRLGFQTLSSVTMCSIP